MCASTLKSVMEYMPEVFRYLAIKHTYRMVCLVNGNLVIDMSPSNFAFLNLLLAIIFEVIGSAYMQKSEQFTKFWPSLSVIACYCISFYAMSHTLKYIPMGVAYALWGGIGIILTATIGLVVFKQTLDTAALAGISLIVIGVVVMQFFSRSVVH